MSRSKAEVLSDISELVKEYLAAETEHTEVMVTGWVMKVSGRAFDDEGVTRLTSWAHAEDQDQFMTLGLADALAQDVTDWYGSGIDYGDD